MFWSSFSDRSRDVAWQPILWAKWAKLAYSPSFVVLAFQNRVDYRNYDCKRFICNDMAKSCNNLVNLGPVTPEFKRVKAYIPCQSVVWLRSLGGATAKPCGISTEFCVNYSLGGVTDMPRGLHARLCHAFLIKLLLYKQRFNVLYLCEFWVGTPTNIQNIYD